MNLFYKWTNKRFPISLVKTKLNELFQFDLLRPDGLNNSRIMSWFTYKNPTFDVRDAVIPGLNLGFSSKENQHIVLKNIHELCKSIGISHRDLALANQIHSANVLQVDKGGVYLM